MFRQFVRKFEISLLTFLLCLGVGVSSIGVTWCRYQVTHEDYVMFSVKEEGEYFVVSENPNWVKEENSQNLNLEFSVVNTITDEIPFTSHRFHVRWNSTTEQEISLFVRELSGREKEYKGVLAQSKEGLYSYIFVDEYGSEVMMNLEANEVSEEKLKLSVKDPEQSFGSEIVIVDDSYEIEKQNVFSSTEAQPLTLISNLLSNIENRIIEINGEVTLSMMSSRDVSSRIYVINENEDITATVNDLEEMSMDLMANSAGTVTLKLTKDVPVAEEDTTQEDVLPEESETPEPSTEPEVSETPEPSEEPEESQQPSVTEELVEETIVSEAPVVTEEPVETEQTQLMTLTVEDTASLESTESPLTTKTPVPTATPAETEVPVVTETPVDTTSPEPVVTDSPLPTESPEASETPETSETTQTPETSETPEITVEPEVIDSPVAVVWEILNEQGEVIEEYKAQFVLKDEKIWDEDANVTLTSINSSFNQYGTLDLKLNTDLDTAVSVTEGDGFPVFTKYSLDNGESWYVLLEKGNILLDLKQGIETSVMIDFSETEQMFENKDYSVIASINEKQVYQLNVKMEKAEITVLEIIESKMGVVTNGPISFVMNIDSVTITLEKLVYNSYEQIDKDVYLNWSTEDNLTYQISVKEDTEIPNGNYRVIITQTVNDRVVKKEILSFYAMGR